MFAFKGPVSLAAPAGQRPGRRRIGKRLHSTLPADLQRVACRSRLGKMNALVTNLTKKVPLVRNLLRKGTSP